MFKVLTAVIAFSEHPIVDITLSEPTPYDVISINKNEATSFIKNGSFNQDQYCRCLLSKLFELPKADLPAFFDYQCESLSEPVQWLNAVEKLLAKNKNLIDTEEHFIRINKILIVIIFKINELEKNNYTNPARFDFDRLRKKVNSVSSIDEKILILMRAQTDYLQEPPPLIRPGAVPFDEKVRLELELLKMQSTLKIGVSSTGEPSSKPLPKIKTNLNLNQFVDIFYNLMHEYRVDGKPALEADANAIAFILSQHLIDKSGFEVSAETVKTILKPSRIEKRPKGSNKIVLKFSE